MLEDILRDHVKSFRELIHVCGCIWFKCVVNPFIHRLNHYKANFSGSVRNVTTNLVTHMFVDILCHYVSVLRVFIDVCSCIWFKCVGSDFIRMLKQYKTNFSRPVGDIAINLGTQMFRDIFCHYVSVLL